MSFLVCMSSVAVLLATPPTLMVVTRPDPMPLAGSGVLTTQAVLDALAFRLAPLGVRVAMEDGVDIPHWRLEVVGTKARLEISLLSPEGGVVTRRTIPLAGRKARDLEQTIVLTTLEGMSALIEELMSLLPARIELVEEPALPRTELDQGALPVVATSPNEVAASPWVASLGAASALAMPGHGARWGGFASAQWQHPRFMMQATCGAWAPVRARGANYHLRANQGLCALALGYVKSFASWQVGASAGPALRGVYVQQSGVRAQFAERTYFNWGGNIRATLAWWPHAHWGVTLTPSWTRYVRYQRFTADAEPVLTLGSTENTLLLALAWRP